MCEPISLAIAGIAISTAVGAVSAGMGAMAEQQAATYNAQMAERNAQLAEMQAQDIEKAGKEEELKYRRQIEQLKGRQRASFGASGALVDTGSPFDVMSDTTKFGEMDALTIRYNTAKQAWGSRVQGSNYQSQANLFRSKAANISPWLTMGTSVLGSAGSSLPGIARFLKK